MADDNPIRTERRSRSRSPKNRGGNSREVRGKECRVFVSNLSYEAKWMELKDVMKQHGRVMHVELLTDNTGRSKGSAIVEFSQADEAATAIKEIDGQDFQGRKLRLREDNLDDSEYENQLRTQKEKSRNLKNSGLSSQPIRSSGSASAGAQGGASGGLGFLLGGGSAQLIQFFNNKGGDPVNSSVFISNLDFDVNWQKVKDEFKRAGNCIRCDIALGDDQRSKGFGSAQFETPFEALTAVAMFNGLELGLRRRKMTVRLDRNSAVHQVLGQLGVPSNEVTEKTIQQLQSIATLSQLTSSGALGGLGGLGVLSQLSSLVSGGNPLQNQSAPSALSNLAGLSGLSGGSSAMGGLESLLTGSVASSLPNAGGMANSSISGGSYGNTNRRDSDNYNSTRPSRDANRNEPSAPPGCRVFVRNLPFSLRWQDVKDKFKEAGRVTHAALKTNEDGRSKGCGTVSFEVPEDANRAVSLFNGSQIDGREIEVRIDQKN